MDTVEQKKHLVLSIIKFLQDELDKSDLTEEKKESVEVAIQCLETAYDTSGMQEENVINLLSLIPSTSAKKVTDQQKLEAERCKNEGNTAIKNEQYTEALFFYTKAIDLNPYNAVYYCNRAAVYSKLDKHLEALKDSKEAIKLDPTYGKAYSRLGVAYSNLNLFEEARTAYKTALKHDPNNAMYENNLKLAEERLAQSQSGGGSTGQLPVDMAQFFNNPALIGMATQMLSDPNFRNTIFEFLNTNQMDNYNMDMLFQAGSALASRMNDVEGVRRNPQDDSNSSGEPKQPEESQP
ncbi:small glutamine-rich tetratricopeptide repeat-containing protein alpha-like [Coccinella septempunctata]|uniref:small glutamine-rich tetratricopeptide repeat-containing protein alpha-like n=1 Tax=Coccinella septempunctata TaxID=41139 RepID=UPI001D05EABF|nr:small glutamine-rich tetratricopeptide repeat-containing protein alpha-like [Coccinella septempunctata]